MNVHKDIDTLIVHARLFTMMGDGMVYLRQKFRARCWLSCGRCA